MILSKLEIKNFRSIENESIDINSINLIVGKNDSGKTNLLRAINCIFSGDYKIKDIDRSTFFTTTFGTGNIMKDKEVKLSAFFKFSDDVGSKKFRNLYSTGVEPICLIRSNDNYKISFKTTNQGPSLTRATAIANEAMQNIIPQILYIDLSTIYKSSDIYNSWEDVETEIKSLLAEDDNRSFRETQINKLLEMFWSSDAKCEVLLREANPNDLSCEFRDGYKIKGKINQRGTGFQAYLYIVLQILKNIFIANSENRDIVILIEEPERMLHPQAQRDFIRFIEYTTAQSNNCKFIITTHSPIIINTSNSSTVYLFEKDGDGKTIINKKPYLDNWRQLRLNLGILPSDSLIIGKVTVLVEGLSEQLFIPQILKKVTQLDIYNIQFVNSNGAGNMQYLARFIKNLPTKIIALVDGDKRGDEARKALTNKCSIDKNLVVSLDYGENRPKDIAFEDIFDSELLTQALLSTYEGITFSTEDIEEFRATDSQYIHYCWARLVEEFLVSKGALEYGESINKIEICRYLVQKIDQLPERLENLVNVLESALNN